jgi:hypothetical protein
MDSSQPLENQLSILIAKLELLADKLTQNKIGDKIKE